ncbi:hypothetical protein [Streptomyces diastaticus]|uniref:hypothetical protein n=1 Tax=Streptomyces diastaticus TaxID=1956 RepID=UPI00364E415F
MSASPVNSPGNPEHHLAALIGRGGSSHPLYMSTLAAAGTVITVSLIFAGLDPLPAMGHGTLFVIGLHVAIHTPSALSRAWSKLNQT